MIEPTHATSAVDGARLRTQTATPRARATTATTGGHSFAGELARFVSASTSDSSAQPASVKAVARPDNEHTTKVAGHPYARIRNGADKGLYLNQLEGSPREGAVFRLVERDDRVFHVYGDGKDKVVVEVRRSGASGAAQPSGGTAPAAT